MLLSTHFSLIPTPVQYLLYTFDVTEVFILLLSNTERGNAGGGGGCQNLFCHNLMFLCIFQQHLPKVVVLNKLPAASLFLSLLRMNKESVWG